MYTGIKVMTWKWLVKDTEHFSQTKYKVSNTEVLWGFGDLYLQSVLNRQFLKWWHMQKAEADLCDESKLRDVLLCYL